MRLYAMALGLIASGIAVQAVLGYDFVGSRLTETRDNRTFLWLPLLELVERFPLLGTGYGTLAYIEPLTRQADGADFYIEYAHNEYLQVCVEAGLLGFACVVSLLVALALRCKSLLASSSRNTMLYAGLLLALTVVAIHSLVEFGLAIPAIAILCCVAFGHIAGLKSKSIKLSYVARLVFVLFMLTCSIVVVWQAKLRDLAERKRWQAKWAAKTDDPVAQLTRQIEAAALDPYNIELQLDAAVLEGKLYDRSGDARLLRASLSRLQLVRELCPLAADAHFMLGQRAQELDRSEDPLVHYERARKCRPADATLAFMAGRHSMLAGNVEDAIRHFRDSLGLSSEHLPAILSSAAADLDRSQLSQMLPDVPRSLSDCATWFEADLGDIDLATSTRQMALRQLGNADSVDDLYLRQQLHRELGDLPQAIATLKQALRLEPNNLAWRYELACVLRDDGQIDAAIAETRRLLQLGPDDQRIQRLVTELSRLKGEMRLRGDNLMGTEAAKPEETTESLGRD